MRINRMFLFLLLCTGWLCAEHFIVKKTKQIVVAYVDQWCDQFGQFLQLSADFDACRSVMQKQGVKEIMHACESGKEVAVAQLSKEDQQRAVQQLNTINDLMQKTVHACKEYTQLMTKNTQAIAKK